MPNEIFNPLPLFPSPGSDTRFIVLARINMSNNEHQMSPKNEQSSSQNGQGRAFNEELEVAGSQLVERVRELIEEGTVRRLIIRNAEGRTLLEIPLSFGAVAGGALLV